MQIMLMNIIEDDAKIIYLIPKGTKFTKPGKLGLTLVPKIFFHKFQCCTYNSSKKHILEYYSCFLLVDLNINNLQTFFPTVITINITNYAMVMPKMLSL